jgi:hypothetical protein
VTVQPEKAMTVKIMKAGAGHCAGFLLSKTRQGTTGEHSANGGQVSAH